MKARINSGSVRFSRRKPLLIWLATVSIATALQAGDFIYEINSHDISTVTVTDYMGVGGNIIIPSDIDGRTVTIIGSHAFYYCNTMTGLSIPDSVITIEPEAFIGCSGLTEVTIPDSVVSVEAGAFRGCTGLTNVVIGAGVEHIAMNAGDFCLAGAFSDCPALHTLSVDTENAVYCAVNGVLYDKDQSTLVLYPPGKEGNYFVPHGVQTIAPSAFRDCSSLTNVYFSGSSVTAIGSMAFYGCAALESVTIPDGVTTIPSSAFRECISLTDVCFTNSYITTIGSMAFHGCAALERVEIPDSVTAIGTLAFYGCTSLSAVSIPEGVVHIGDSAFCECTSLLSVDVDPANTEYTGIDGALYDANAATLIAFPAGITGNYKIPAGVKTITCSSFSCSGLTSLTIPESVTRIEDCAFKGCTKLNNIYFKGDAPVVGVDVFLGSSKVKLYYLGGTTGWSPTLSGRPTALWLSPRQCEFRKLIAQPDEVLFNIVGTANQTVVVEYKKRLSWWSSWQPVLTNTIPVNDTLTFSDFSCTNQPTGFYRLRML